MMKVQKNHLNPIEIKFILSPRDIELIYFSMFHNQKEVVI
jgi:hypothetical protein